MTNPQTGQLLALLSATSFAAGSVFVSKGATGKGDRGVMFSVLVTILFSGSAWLAIEGGSFGHGANGLWWRGVGWFILAGVLAMVFGRSLVFASIRRLGVMRSSAVKRLNPFFSVLLAWLFLAEPISGWDGLGMVTIAVAFVILLRESWLRAGTGHNRPAAGHYAWGVGSALSYAFAYVARKSGLELIAAPAFGTMVSAVAGFAFFLLMALFSSRYRDSLRNMFTYLNRWLILAAVFMSLGQILMFAALFYEKVSTVVMISSLEVFIATFLSVVVFRTERRPDGATYLAAALASAGVMAVAWG